MKELISELEKLKKNLKEFGGLKPLEPFDRCLVRNSPCGLWIPALYGKQMEDGKYLTSAGFQTFCIPFEGNKEVLGTTDMVCYETDSH